MAVALQGAAGGGPHRRPVPASAEPPCGRIDGPRGGRPRTKYLSKRTPRRKTQLFLAGFFSNRTGFGGRYVYQATISVRRDPVRIRLQHGRFVDRKHYRE